MAQNLLSVRNGAGACKPVKQKFMLAKILGQNIKVVHLMIEGGGVYP